MHYMKMNTESRLAIVPIDLSPWGSNNIICKIRIPIIAVMFSHCLVVTSSCKSTSWKFCDKKVVVTNIADILYMCKGMHVCMCVCACACACVCVHARMCVYVCVCVCVHVRVCIISHTLMLLAIITTPLEQKKFCS